MIQNWAVWLIHQGISLAIRDVSTRDNSRSSTRRNWKSYNWGGITPTTSTCWLARGRSVFQQWVWGFNQQQTDHEAAMHSHSIKGQQYHGLLWAKSSKQVEESEPLCSALGEAACSHTVARSGFPRTKETWIYWNILCCRTTKILYVLYYLSYEKRLRELCLFSLKKGQSMGDLVHKYKYPTAQNKDKGGYEGIWGGEMKTSLSGAQW